MTTMSDDRLISLKAAIDAVNNMMRRKFGISADLGTNALQVLPPAQPEIIRCKDCHQYKPGWCYLHEINMNDDDFCSRGKSW